MDGDLRISLAVQCDATHSSSIFEHLLDPNPHVQHRTFRQPELSYQGGPSFSQAFEYVNCFGE
jgi:hypothetical protein